jgi:hypothetical protein
MYSEDDVFCGNRVQGRGVEVLAKELICTLPTFALHLPDSERDRRHGLLTEARIHSRAAPFCTTVMQAPVDENKIGKSMCCVGTSF